MSKKKLKLTLVREDVIVAINMISSAFTWKETSEGHNYWSDVVKKLERISKSK